MNNRAPCSPIATPAPLRRVSIVLLLMAIHLSACQFPPLNPAYRRGTCREEAAESVEDFKDGVRIEAGYARARHRR